MAEESKEQTIRKLRFQVRKLTKEVNTWRKHYGRIKSLLDTNG